jgi:hypothetical protein
VGVVGGWVVKVSKVKETGRGGEKIKFQKKNRDQEKKHWEGGREKIKLQTKTEIRAEKGQTRKVNLGSHRDRKENPISAPSIHVGALVGAASLRPNFIRKHFFFKCVCWYALIP